MTFKAAELGAQHHSSAPLAADENRNTPGGGSVEQQQAKHMDRRAAMLEAFDSMNDECQLSALTAVCALARKFPRRATVTLSLVSPSPTGGGRQE